MKCPFCEQEMIAGEMSGDGRSRVYWEAYGDKLGLADKIAGKGRIGSVQYSIGKFKLQSQYCPNCKKMIFDTDISQ